MSSELTHLRRSFCSPRWAIPLVLLASTWIAVRAAGAQTYGTLSNFDVFNDTGEDCHGFEIELDGLSSADVTFTFGQPYQRYGDPVVVDFPGGVYVRYESPYDSMNQVFTATTAIAPTPITPTAGHACWTGGSADYLTGGGGCEHFGVGLRGNPTGTVYRWLIADPANPGSLQPAGTKVSIPAPAWNVVPQAGAGPVVRAVIPAEPPEVEAQYGDAMWVKVFVTESPEPAELHHLVTDDPRVPQEQGETEVEWVILQAAPPGQQGENELANEGQAGAGAESVTRRYEFYKYTGAYDPENHEVMCGGDGSCDAPLEGELGDYIGAQMAAVNLSPLDVPTETPTEAPTEAPTANATPTPPAAVCAGNCNGDGSVAINELITLVNIALGEADASACAEGIPPAASIDIALLIQAVNNALDGCPVLAPFSPYPSARWSAG